MIGVQFPAQAGNSSDTTSRPALGPIQLPIQWVPRALSLEIKQPGHEADHSPPSSTKIKECKELHLHSPNKSSWYGAKLNTETTLCLPSNRLENSSTQLENGKT
jgi:hypothetical protein